MVYEVYTNKATTDYRDTTIGSQRVIIRRPYVEINDGNASILQFLDLMKEVRDIAAIDGTDLTDRLIGYMKAKGLMLLFALIYLLSINVISDKNPFVIRNGSGRACSNVYITENGAGIWALTFSDAASACPVITR